MVSVESRICLRLVDQLRERIVPLVGRKELRSDIGIKFLDHVDATLNRA